MIFGQLASAAMLFTKFHVGTRTSLLDFWPPLLERPIKSNRRLKSFVLSRCFLLSNSYLKVNKLMNR